jgi:acetyl esterase/lipase
MADPNPSPDLLTFQTMYLCGVAYEADPALMPALIEKTQVPPTGGNWRCLWGPAQDSDESNLAFVAGYYTATSAAPEFICVTIRGTDVDVSDIWGILEQIWEDIDGADPQPMPWALDDPARVASGTLDGLTVIQELTDPTSGQTLSQFLTELYLQPANANVKTVVTGHSLGGCLATIVAMWIRVLLPNIQGVIQPITWAAPTAGNCEFATYYSELFPTARRFQNTLDIIPKALQHLGDIDDVYANNDLSAPSFVEFCIRGMMDLMSDNGATYMQPSQGAQILTGNFLTCDQGDWYAQALHQHHLATYLSVLTGQPLDETALPKSTAPRARNRRRSRAVASSATR